MLIASHFIAERGRRMDEITPTSVTQGKTNVNEDCCAAAHATDRDLFTAAIAVPTVDGNNWLKLQFDKLHLIKKIMIYYKFFTNWYDPKMGCVETETRFKSCVNDDSNVDVSVYQGEVKQKSCGTLQLTYGLEQSDQIYTLICEAVGDTVKLSKNSGNIAVNEVVVLSNNTGKL